MTWGYIIALSVRVNEVRTGQRRGVILSDGVKIAGMSVCRQLFGAMSCITSWERTGQERARQGRAGQDIAKLDRIGQNRTGSEDRTSRRVHGAVVRTIRSS